MDGDVSCNEVYDLFAVNFRNILNINLIPFFLDRGVPFTQSMHSIVIHAVVCSEKPGYERNGHVVSDLSNVLDYLHTRKYIELLLRIKTNLIFLFVRLCFHDIYTTYRANPFCLLVLPMTSILNLLLARIFFPFLHHCTLTINTVYALVLIMRTLIVSVS
jgi:hypothetical protein